MLKQQMFRSKIIIDKYVSSCSANSIRFIEFSEKNIYTYKKHKSLLYSIRLVFLRSFDVKILIAIKIRLITQPYSPLMRTNESARMEPTLFSATHTQVPAWAELTFSTSKELRPDSSTVTPAPLSTSRQGILFDIAGLQVYRYGDV